MQQGCVSVLSVTVTRVLKQLNRLIYPRQLQSLHSINTVSERRSSCAIQDSSCLWLSGVYLCWLLLYTHTPHTHRWPDVLLWCPIQTHCCSISCTQELMLLFVCLFETFPFNLAEWSIIYPHPPSLSSGGIREGAGVPLICLSVSVWPHTVHLCVINFKHKAKIISAV